MQAALLMNTVEISGAYVTPVNACTNFRWQTQQRTLGRWLSCRMQDVKSCCRRCLNAASSPSHLRHVLLTTYHLCAPTGEQKWPGGTKVVRLQDARWSKACGFGAGPGRKVG